MNEWRKFCIYTSKKDLKRKKETFSGKKVNYYHPKLMCSLVLLKFIIIIFIYELLLTDTQEKNLIMNS